MAISASEIENRFKTNARNQTNTFNKTIRVSVDNTESGRGTGYFYINFKGAASTTTFNGVKDASIVPGGEIKATGITDTVTNAIKKAVDHIESRMGNSHHSYNFCHSSCHNNCHNSRGRR
jgi:hypothetical protein